MDIGALVQQGIELLKTTGLMFKDTAAAVAPLIGPGKALWNWARSKFATNKPALEKLEQVEQDPENERLLGKLETELEHHLADDPAAQSELADLIADLTEAMKNAPAATHNYMQNNSSTYGPIIQNFSGGTFHYNVDTKKKPPKN